MNPDPLIGQQLGNYRITSLLGEGGMARVYRASHVSMSREAAVKVLAPNLAYSPDVVRRFEAEAEAVNRIKHPNIVQIFDIGKLGADGRPYYMMELFEGESLADRIKRRGAMPVAEALDIIDTVLDALDATHRANIIHRDLKPDNVFLATAAGRTTVKLLDFGIAKLAGDGVDKTRTGALMGTPAYMGPEQCEGRQSEIGPATDLYAVGCMLYEMLAGVVPFDAQSLGGLIKQHMMMTPRPLAERVRDLPPGISDIVARCLAKEPADRPPSADALRKDLARFSSRPSRVEDTLPAPHTASTIVAGGERRTPSAPTIATGAGQASSPTGGARLGAHAAPTNQPWSSPSASPPASGEPRTVVLPPPGLPPLAPKRSRLPVALGAIVVVAGATVAVLMVTRNSGSTSDAAIDAPAVDAAIDARPLPDAATPDAPPIVVDGPIDGLPPIDAPLTMTERLEALKNLCREGVFAPAECATRRQQILDEWGRQR